MQNRINKYIIYEDKDVLVINKPAGLVVHEGAGEYKTTIANMLIKNYPEIAKFSWPDITRPGIVHRLDKDTSGAMIIAKNPKTLEFLQKQFKNRLVEKIYLALIFDKIEPKEGIIKIPIIRHAKKNKMTVSYLNKGKTALTYYKTIKNYTCRFQSKDYNLTFLKIKPETGRMHQIRVHLKHKKHPIIGDQIYNTKISKKISDYLGLKRQFLHAYKLKIQLPNKTIKCFKSELPNDINKILQKIKGN